jgi:succinoglycan biosynthesis transport protein ExoP
MRDDFVKLDTLSPPAGGTDLSDLGRTLRKRWLVVVAVAATVFGGVAFSTLTTTPKYQSETLILLDNKTAVPVVTTIVPQEVATGKDLSTEIQILQSPSLVAKAISYLQAPYKNMSVTEVAKNLSIRQAGQADVLIVSYTDTDPQRTKALLEALGSTYVDYSLERKRSQATNAIKFIQEQLPAAQKALNEVTETIRNFRQRYGIVDPDSYAAEVVQSKQSLQQQTQALEAAISKTQRQYQELQRQMVAVGQNPQTALANALLSQDSVYEKLASQLKEIEAKYTQESSRFTEDHPVLVNLRKQRDSLLRLLQYRTGHVLGNAAAKAETSDVSGYGGTQQNLAQQLLQVQTELASQMSQLESLERSAKETAVRFEQIPQLQQTYAELQREFKVKSEAVNNFLAKLQELRISEAQETAPWKIIEQPYLPETPVSPNVRRNLLLGLIAGGLLGVGAAVLLERTDQRVKRVEEAKELTGLASLGMVPQVELPVLVTHSRENGRLQGYHNSRFTEAIRSLALNLRYLGANGLVKTLAFTSSTPSEGKSTLAYNIGRVLGELGHRVLLVDADMRKPTIHQFLKRPNMFGLSSAIATDTPWRQLVYSADGGHLDVITSGPTPPNPVALLDSAKMTQLLSEWRQTYDYVLIDSTPILGISDAQSIAPKADAVILVAALERSTRSSLTQTMEVLQRSRCNVAGLVANFVEQEEDGSYYPYYYSYYTKTELNGNGNEPDGDGDGPASGERGILGKFLGRR